MKAHEYADRIAGYLVHHYGDRGVQVYREVPVGKTVIGKNRRVDILVLSEPENEAYVLECKYQDTAGTTDEKIPYAMEDMRSLPIPGCIVYAGTGWSKGVLHTLQASEIAAYCLPDAAFAQTAGTAELDHLLAMRFKWWDVLVRGRTPFGETAR